MANGVTTDTRNWDRAHSDIEVVKSRMTSLENSFIGFGEQLRDIGKRLDSKPTDIWKIVGGIVGILALIGAFLYQGKAYIDADLDRHDREIGRLMETALSKEDFKTEADLQQRRNIEGDSQREKIKDELEASRIELAKWEGVSSDRHENYIRDHAALS